jgi:predicted GNAT family N-acyltransferase
MKIVSDIMKYIKEEYPKGTMVCLMSAKGKENFYKKFGFVERPNENYGAGMIQFT